MLACFEQVNPHQTLLVASNGTLSLLEGGGVTCTQTHIKKGSDTRWTQVTNTQKSTYTQKVKQAIVKINS